MKLQWIQYNNKAMLFLNIGVEGDKAVGFDASMLPEAAVKELRIFKESLETKPHKDQIEWLRRMAPNAIRTLFAAKIRVLKDYDVMPMKMS